MKVLAIVMLGIFLPFNNLLAQSEDKPVILNHADSLVGTVMDGEQVKQLIGNVKMTHGNIVMTCERATQYVVSKKVLLEGEVIVHQDTMTLMSYRGVYYPDSKTAEGFEEVRLNDGKTYLRAQYGKYFTDEKKAYFKGNVKVEDSTSILSADELTYFREAKKTIAVGNVRITDLTSNITIYGGHFENERARNYSIMTIEPRAIQIDAAPDGMLDTMTVTSKKMESYQDSTPRLIATDDVEMTYGELSSQSGKAVFFTALDSMVLEKSPYVWYSRNTWETTQVSGDSMFVKMKLRQIETVYIRGRAVAISVADSLFQRRYNQLTGHEIVLHFSEKKIEQLDVNKTATMVYFLFDEDKPNGLNKTSGDNVVMAFVNGKIEKIKVVGGIEGQYIPEKLVGGREQEYNLPGFNWKQHRPGKLNAKSEKKEIGSKE
jgi:lipopolysaccharide export system protein LptA